jgi:hypothetical protein
MHERRLQIERGGIEPRKDMQRAARKIPQLIMLVVDDEARRQVRRDRRFGIFDDHDRVGDSPGMLVEPAAEHLTELGPREKAGRAGVRGDKSVALVADKPEEIGFLLRREIDLARDGGFPSALVTLGAGMTPQAFALQS